MTAWEVYFDSCWQTPAGKQLIEQEKPEQKEIRLSMRACGPDESWSEAFSSQLWKENSMFLYYFFSSRTRCISVAFDRPVFSLFKAWVLLEPLRFGRPEHWMHFVFRVSLLGEIEVVTPSGILPLHEVTGPQSLARQMVDWLQFPAAIRGAVFAELLFILEKSVPNADWNQVARLIARRIPFHLWNQ
jgi:hypothetical protein